MQGPNNIFTADANALAAFTGRGSPNLKAVQLTSGGTDTLDVDFGMAQSLTTAAGNTTISINRVGLPGQRLTLTVLNDAGGARTLTFDATKFRTTATLVGTASQYRTIGFVSDGTKWNEVSRVAAMVA